MNEQRFVNEGTEDVGYESQTIRNSQALIEAAREDGWEVYAYSEYASDGIPACAEIRRKKKPTADAE